MSAFVVPVGLKEWDAYIALLFLSKPFPPPNEPPPKRTLHWDRISTCALLCEEIFATEPSTGVLTPYYHELVHRGFTDAEIQELRHFIWLTAGWLLKKKPLWEFAVLDEPDIHWAIDCQQREGLIDGETACSMHEYLADKLKRSQQDGAGNSHRAGQ